MTGMSVTLQMGIGEAFTIALGTLVTPEAIFFIFIGTLLGLILGAIPGLGGLIAVALLIPITFGMDTLLVFVLLATVLGGSTFGGSLSAILINTPGTPPNAATLIDGYPMTRNGEAGRAISAAAVSSALGAVFGILILVLSIPVLRELSLLFGPPEIFWLGVWGLLILSLVVKGSVLSGLVSGVLGLVFALHGINNMTANVRWGYGITWLYDGWKIVPALIGLFAVAEMLSLLSKNESIVEAEKVEKVKSGVRSGLADLWENKLLFLRSSAVGTIVGIIPGIGGMTATFIAYYQATQTTKDPDRFGKGDVRGVIAPEAAADAKDGGAFIPTLGLGIPGSAAMVVIFGAFLLHGIQPGPLLMRDHLDLVMIIVMSLLVSNILTSLMGLASVNYIARIITVDVNILAPIIVCVAYFGAYGISNNIFDLYITLLFGILGFAMVKINMSRVPLILGMVMAPIVERNYFRTLQLQDTYVHFFDSVISLILVALIFLTFFLPPLRTVVSRWVSGGFSMTGGSEADSARAASADTAEQPEMGNLEIIRNRPLSFLLYVSSFIWILLLLIIAQTWVSGSDWLFPTIVGSIALVLIALKLFTMFYGPRLNRFLPQSFHQSYPDGDAPPLLTRLTNHMAKRELAVTAWVVALPMALYLFGFPIVLPLYLFAFLYYFQGTISVSAKLTVVTILAMYVLFVVLLGATLWTGVLL